MITVVLIYILFISALVVSGYAVTDSIIKLGKTEDESVRKFHIGRIVIASLVFLMSVGFILMTALG